MSTTSVPRKSSAVQGKQASKAVAIRQPVQGTAGGRKPTAGRGKVAATAAASTRGTRDAAASPVAADRAEAAAGMLTSKVTERLQTTLPPGVRQVLGIKGGERVGYVIDGEGIRLINASRATEHDDPVLQQFVALLGRHLAAGPAAGGAVPFSPDLLARARAVTAGVEIDHNAPIEGAISL